MFKIDTPMIFLDRLISDTWGLKIQWTTFDFEFGLRHLVNIPVYGTTKYLRIEVFNMGNPSYIKIDFYTQPSENIRFDNIKFKDHSERIARLIKAIHYNVENMRLKEISDKYK